MRSIGWTTSLPYGESRNRAAAIRDCRRSASPPGDRPIADFQAADPGYFTTLDLPAISGRSFTERDTREATPVCLVSEAFVRRYLAGRNPIGVRVGIDPLFAGQPVPRAWEIVGVVPQVKGRTSEADDRPQMYVPLAQYPWTDTLPGRSVARRPGHGASRPIREAVARIDRNLPVRRERTLTDLASTTTAPHRFRAVIVATFAALALTLALVGDLGVLMYSVEQRMREFGVRIALGATSVNVLKLVLGSAARVIALGTVVGLAGSRRSGAGHLDVPVRRASLSTR